MKKSILFLALAASITFSSCSDDDEQSCRTCDEVEYCINDDGSISVSDDGEGNSTTIPASELGELSPEEAVELICTLGEITELEF